MVSEIPSFHSFSTTGTRELGAARLVGWYRTRRVGRISIIALVAGVVCSEQRLWLGGMG
jgi:hypothetical protein